MNIFEKIESWRDRKGQAFGAIISSLNHYPQLLSEINRLTEFLNPYYNNISIQQRFYHIWFGFYDIEKCPYCGLPKMFVKKPKFSIDRYGTGPTNPVNYYATCMSESCSKKHNKGRTDEALIEKYGTSNIMRIPGVFDRMKETNKSKYGSDYYMGTDSFKNKVKETFEKKYGGHPAKLESVQQKKRKTNWEKYGVDNALLNPEVKEKSRKTTLERYGGNSSMCSDSVKEKAKETNRRKRGVDWYVQSDDFKAKFRETMLSKYGVEQVMHYADHFEKAKETSRRRKIFIFPSGRIEKIQGYEGFAIKNLLNSGYSEDDIVINSREIEKYTGRIFYYDSYDDKTKRYYPDIYIISENRIVEVKCDYTYNSGYSRNILKKKACIDKGIAFEFWVYDDKMNLAIK